MCALFVCSSKPGMAELEQEILTLCAHIQAATYRLLMLIREYDENEAWAGEGVRSCAHWLTWRCGIGVVAAREKVRVAHALKALPEISEAFRQGELSYSKVRAMARVATPENEALLLTYARHGTAAQVETLTRKYRDHQVRLERQRANDQQDRRELSYYWDGDGSLVIQARVPAEEGARVLKALELAVEALEPTMASGADDSAESPATPGKGDVPTQSGSADDSAESPEVAWTPVAVEGKPYPMWGATVSRDSSWARYEAHWWPIAARRADALVLLADTLLAHGPASRPLPERYLVTVHVDAETLRQPHSPGRCDLEDGRALAAETARRLACDGSLVTLFEDAKRQPLGVGRKTRTIPPAIQRALQSRDEYCRFPGCAHRRWLESHHVHHWADGGETSLPNLARLCRFHHKLVHERGFSIEVLDDGALRFLDPDRQPIDPNPPVVALDPRSSVQSLNEAQGLRIDASTGECLWEGYRPDYGTAVGGLQMCDGIRAF